MEMQKHRKIIRKIGQLLKAKSVDERLWISKIITRYINSLKLLGSSMDATFKKLVTSQIESYAVKPIPRNRKMLTDLIQYIRQASNLSTAVSNSI